MCRTRTTLTALTILSLLSGGCAASIEQQARTAAADHRREDTVRDRLRCAPEEIQVSQLAELTSPPEYALASFDPNDLVRWSKAGELYYAACPDSGYFVILHCPPPGPCEPVRDNFGDIICPIIV